MLKETIICAILHGTGFAKLKSNASLFRRGRTNMSNDQLLIISEEQTSDSKIYNWFSKQDFCQTQCCAPSEVSRYLEQRVDLILCDTGEDVSISLELLYLCKQQAPEVPFLILSHTSDVVTAVAAMKQGADEFLVKPLQAESLVKLVKGYLQARQSRVAVEEKHGSSTARLGRYVGFEKMVGTTQVMQQLFERAQRVAGTDSTVLITGESGTGKELLAEAIHRNSPRGDRPFVTINMAAVPEHLVESELFGHVKGSFTGASESRVGRFEAAHGGTLFIDEIGDFKLESQAKLLRVLENHRVTLIGSNRDREVDVRVIAATSHPLQQMVQTGDFREDLFYRLNVVNLALPPLRERRDDIPVLVNFFLRQLCQCLKRDVPVLDPELEAWLRNGHWPGNIRQLRNCLESMLVLSREEVLTLADLPEMMNGGQLAAGQIAIPAGTRLEDLERTAIEQTLKRYRGNRTQSARSLGVSVRTLQRKLKAWGVTADYRGNGQSAAAKKGLHESETISSSH
ncbi:sigma-54-dependent Fis family transcriptional regulator [Gimesia chilikensis]|nr:sigma-54-dependent Fis family transcriptional regulator [Gimesia chilikensis]